ncbi:MAG: hypothetical protein M3R36_05370 [Bacteroidota bacterium]|nr:hypothetical protein [Bacteroidota bacterium]
MTRNNEVAQVNSERNNSSKKEIEILKKKLKLDDNIVGLLVNSRGSIKDKSFFDKVMYQINQI